MNEKPLRLLFIGDGSGIHTARWVRFFLGRGYEAGLVSLTPPAHGSHLAEFFELSPKGPLPGTRLLKNILEARSAIASFAPDVLHAHYINEAGWLGALSGFHPLVITAWGSDIYRAPRESRLAARLSPWSVRRADWVTADSRAQVQALCTMGARADRASVVNWGVEMVRFDSVLLRESGMAFRAKHGLTGDSVIVLAPRQWIENSNIDVVVDAFASLHTRFPQARLFLKRMNANPTEYAARIEAQIARLNLGSTVQILEEMPEADLPQMYAAADIMISICTSDGTPVSLLEALAARSAVIVSDLPDLAEWVEDGVNGFRVPARDTGALVHRMEMLIDDARLRQNCATAGRRIAEARADRSQNFHEVERLYRRLAGRPFQIRNDL